MTRRLVDAAGLLTLGVLAACAGAPSSSSGSGSPDVVVLAPDASPTGESARHDAPDGDAPASSASPRPLGPLGRARVESARAQAQSLAAAIELWQASEGADACPRHEDLVRDRVVPPDSDGLDPWGHAFTITCSEAGVTVTSSGPDEEPGTPDDVADR